MYFVYILKCGDKSLYTGITTDVKRRLKEHKSGAGGHYTRAKKVLKIVYIEEQPNRSAAMKREAEIKSWPRAKKLNLIKGSRTAVDRSRLNRLIEIAQAPDKESA